MRNARHDIKHGDLTERLVRTLKEQISDGVYRIGERLPSNRELASEFGVSQVTARMAMLKLYAEGGVEIRKNRGCYLRENPMKTSRSVRVGLVLSPWDSENKMAYDHRTQLADVLKVTGQNDCQLSIFPYRQWTAYSKLENPVEMFVENHIDTVLWFHSSAREIAVMRELRRQGYRQLLLNRRMIGIDLPAIMNDWPGVAKDIVANMTVEQFRSCLIITGGRDTEPMSQGVDILEDALKEHGGYDPERFLYLPASSADGTFLQWAAETVRNTIARLRPALIIDCAGYLNVISKFPPDWLKENGNPALVSSLVPSAWNCPKTFHYLSYSFETAKIGTHLRAFLKNAPLKESIWIPFIKKGI